MSCHANANRVRLAAISGGIRGAASKAFNLAAENRNLLAAGAITGGLAAIGRASRDKAYYEQQAIRSAAYKSTLASVANFAVQGAAAANPATRRAILNQAKNRLSDLGQLGYRGLEPELRQKLQHQHQVVTGWLNRATAADRESGPVQAFVLGAAQAGEFGMKQFVTPNLSPPSTRVALATGMLIGAMALTSYAALSRYRRQSKPDQAAGLTLKMEPVRNSSLASAIGYDDRRRVLALIFKANGRTYLYRAVPPAVARQLRDAPEKGQVFHRHIRGKYETVRLADEPGQNSEEKADGR